MKISIIAALGKKNEIGEKGSLLCHLPADLKHFKELTQGHTVIMGRKTFESLTKGVLPNRRNIIISRNSRLMIDDAEVYISLNLALKAVNFETEVFIIGGSQLYQQTISLARTLYLTEIHSCFPKADIFFPPFTKKEWKEIKRKNITADKINPYSFSFVQYKKLAKV